MLTVISFLPSPLGTAQTVRQQRSTTKNQKVSQLAAVESGCFKGVLNSVALEIPLLVYPADAARRGIGGKVTIKVFVNEMGMVYYASAVGGPRMLRKAALRSAQGSRFTPFTQHDQLIKCAGLLVYTFNPPGRLES
jgi:outer membrane biosynthesis protein TonB